MASAVTSGKCSGIWEAPWHLAMAMASGLTSAITSPLHSEIMQAVRGADVMLGNDPDCNNWINAYREPVAEGSRERRKSRRRSR